MNQNRLTHKLVRTLSVCAIVALALSAAPSTAHAATFTVDSTADAVDANPGDGLCATATGKCTLRAAIQETNALAGDDTITLPAGTYTLTIAGAGEDAAATGDLDITGNLTLTGQGAETTIVDGNGAVIADRVWHIPGEAVVTLSDLLIRNGSPPSLEDGGGIANGGALLLSRATVAGNTVTGAGGGIHNTGTLRLTLSQVIGNLADRGDGGGIYSTGELTLNDSTVADNQSEGGIFDDAIAGGIYNSGSALIKRSTISNNYVAGALFDGGLDAGGGIYNDTGGQMALLNSTIARNVLDAADEGFGAGIYNKGALTLANSTITANRIAKTGGDLGFGGGIHTLDGSSETQNTIIAGNGGRGRRKDCSGPLISHGYNLLGIDTGCNFTATEGDQVGTPGDPIDPLLGPLQDNGGPTDTMALLEGSPAIDAGNPGDCTDFEGTLLVTDQRGLARHVDGDGDGSTSCDSGAYEFGASDEPDFTLHRAPLSLAICAPADAQYHIGLSSILGYSEPVTLSASGHPAGSSATFDPNPVTPRGHSLLTIGNTGAAQAGSYEIEVAGVAATRTHTTTVGLDLYTRRPGPVTLLAPPDGATDVLLQPTLAWTEATRGVRYHLEIATDAGFSDIVYTVSLAGTSHTVQTPLDSGTLYYWRVRSQNVCGDGDYSLTFRFTTLPVVTFTVDSSADAVDANPGDGACASGAGECTLRAAIQETNALPSDDTILVPAGTYTLTIPGSDEDAAATGDLDITGNLSIEGEGSETTIADGNSAVTGDRVFQVHRSANGTLAGLTLRGGDAEGGGLHNTTAGTVTLRNSTISGNTGDTGGIHNDGKMTIDNSTISGNTGFFAGGIHNEGTMTIDNSTISGNTDGDAGGIHNDGTMTIDNSTISGNTGDFGGGIRNDGTMTITGSALAGNTGDFGGGLSNHDTMTITNSTIVGNTAGGGGGIYNTEVLTIHHSTLADNTSHSLGGGILNRETLTLADSTLVGNTAGTGGGGIYSGSGNTDNSSLTVTGSTLAGNTAGEDGGGICNEDTLKIDNSTLSGNTADQHGGGIANSCSDPIYSEGTTTLNNVTLTGNRADADQDGIGEGGGLYLSPIHPNATFFGNTLIAANIGPAGAPDCSASPGELTSHGYNLVGNNAGCDFIPAAGDLVGTPGDPIDPLLDPLQDNGGPTETHALLEGSPAIDAGNPAPPGSGGNACEATDQRGFPRPIDGDGNGSAICDIGSFEYGSAP